MGGRDLDSDDCSCDLYYGLPSSGHGTTGASNAGMAERAVLQQFFSDPSWRPEHVSIHPRCAPLPAFVPPRVDACSCAICVVAPPWAVGLRSAADSAVCRRLLCFARHGHLRQVWHLLAMGADVNFSGADRWTALHRAAAGCHAAVLWVLLSMGAAVNAQTLRGTTPLHIACKNDRRARCVELLISARADIERKDRSGRTPLHAACESGNLNAVRALLNVGARRSEKTAGGYTPAALAKNLKVRELFLVK